ncbi:unnamed protein product [Ostreobium quekettii]|uniref:Uncharacterized protein n=1 Tax=Ostreobium quekettii TaxID=121088 RepID=A0A8S1JCR7_9CHLO|nr:unnamed protein product [Ostreobium quekettii]
MGWMSGQQTETAGMRRSSSVADGAATVQQQTASDMREPTVQYSCVKIEATSSVELSFAAWNEPAHSALASVEFKSVEDCKAANGFQQGLVDGSQVQADPNTMTHNREGVTGRQAAEHSHPRSREDPASHKEPACSLPSIDNSKENDHGCISGQARPSDKEHNIIVNTPLECLSLHEHSHKACLNGETAVEVDHTQRPAVKMEAGLAGEPANVAREDCSVQQSQANGLEGGVDESRTQTTPEVTMECRMDTDQMAVCDAASSQWGRNNSQCCIASPSREAATGVDQAQQLAVEVEGELVGGSLPIAGQDRSAQQSHQSGLELGVNGSEAQATPEAQAECSMYKNQMALREAASTQQRRGEGQCCNTSPVGKTEIQSPRETVSPVKKPGRRPKSRPRGGGNSKARQSLLSSMEQPASPSEPMDQDQTVEHVVAAGGTSEAQVDAGQLSQDAKGGRASEGQKVMSLGKTAVATSPLRKRKRKRIPDEEGQAGVANQNVASFNFAACSVGRARKPSFLAKEAEENQRKVDKFFGIAGRGGAATDNSTDANGNGVVVAAKDPEDDNEMVALRDAKQRLTSGIDALQQRIMHHREELQRLEKELEHASAERMKIANKIRRREAKARLGQAINAKPIVMVEEGTLKGCHRCFGRHKARPCMCVRNGRVCGLSFCNRCLFTLKVSRKTAKIRCPRCTGICNCNACIARQQKLKNLKEVSESLASVVADLGEGRGGHDAKSHSPPRPRKKAKIDTVKKENEGEVNGCTNVTPSSEEAKPLVLTNPELHVGECFNKTKVYDKDGNQISKSCHQCQYQHISYQCRSGASKTRHDMEPCKVSICNRCRRAWYTHMTIEDCMEACPRCRGFCNCKQCLRKESHNKWTPKFSAAQEREFAKHIISYVGLHVKDVLDTFVQEAAEDGDVPERVKGLKLEAEAALRLNCNICSTSIPDFHRTCSVCGYDLCIQCCREQRMRNESSQKVTTICPICLEPLRLQRILRTHPLDLKLLEKAARTAEKFAQQNSTRPCWSWLQNPQGRKSSVSSPRAATNRVAEANGLNTDAPWWVNIPPTSLRLAAWKEGDPRNYLFCPHADDLNLDSPNRAENVRIIQGCFQRGEPFIVRGCKGKMNWTPELMNRATREVGVQRKNIEACKEVQVIDCTKDWGTMPMLQNHFFSAYTRGHEASYWNDGKDHMLKVKDWPPDAHFSEKLARHDQDFREMLPMPEYTDPTEGPLNLRKYLPDSCLPPDLGPKTYIALGRLKEHPGEGDSVTKLHVDLCDAVNILCHAQYNDVDGKSEKEKIHVRSGNELWDHETYGYAGAVWDIVRREDVPHLRDYLDKNRHKFVHHGKPVSEHEKVLDVLQDQMFTLTHADHDALREQYGVHVWHFEQHVNEAVFIPVRCPHQVRNLRSCIKVAVDFLAPESMGECLTLAQELRAVAKMQPIEDPSERLGADKLQGCAMMLYGASEAVKRL